MEVAKIIEEQEIGQVHIMEEVVPSQVEEVVLLHFIDMVQVRNIHWMQQLERNLYLVRGQ